MQKYVDIIDLPTTNRMEEIGLVSDDRAAEEAILQ